MIDEEESMSRDGFAIGFIVISLFVVWLLVNC